MTEREQELRSCLEKLGRDKSWSWVAREPDYVELTGATPEDIPFLVGVMKEWIGNREQVVSPCCPILRMDQWILRRRGEKAGKWFDVEKYPARLWCLESRDDRQL